MLNVPFNLILYYYPKLMSDHEEISSQEAIQIAIKKPTSDKKIKEKKKIVKTKPKKKALVSEDIRHLLQEKISDQRLLKQLESKPFDFGHKETKVIKISEKIQTSKELKNLGISLVHQIKKEKRVGRDRRGQFMKQCSNLRKSMQHIRNLKKK